MAEGEIQVAPDSTGAKVRSLTQTEAAVDSAGAASADLVRHQQVISIAERRGELVEPHDEAILSELRMIRELLEVISLRLS